MVIFKHISDHSFTYNLLGVKLKMVSNITWHIPVSGAKNTEDLTLMDLI